RPSSADPISIRAARSSQRYSITDGEVRHDRRTMTSPKLDPYALRSSLGTSIEADAVYDAFSAWVDATGIRLYPAQDEAIIEIVSGQNLVLSTPTGTGKSLVAIGAHFAALVAGKRSFYTAPIKALVSEKFFALVDVFGAENVGMMTGDSP